MSTDAVIQTGVKKGAETVVVDVLSHNQCLAVVTAKKKSTNFINERLAHAGLFPCKKRSGTLTRTLFNNYGKNLNHLKSN